MEIKVDTGKWNILLKYPLSFSKSIKEINQHIEKIEYEFLQLQQKMPEFRKKLEKWEKVYNDCIQLESVKDKPQKYEGTIITQRRKQ